MYAAQRIPQEHPYHEPVRRPKRKNQQKAKRAVKKKYALELVALMVCLCGVLALNIFLVGRYADITNTRHAVSSLEQRVEQLQNHREQLMVEIERSSKLEWIEEEAKNRLSMKHPEKDQLIYISVDPERVRQVSQRIDRKNSEVEQNDNGLPQPIERIIHRFAGVLRI
ncbi:MAG: hypothetical protein D5S00_11575 [Tindallia sp. MSAO_Bac2]|nr:MAG: hypothetical protein D5S00_11575 [Tindallia sp. MSAO_Bac2]